MSARYQKREIAAKIAVSTAIAPTFHLISVELLRKPVGSRGRGGSVCSGTGDVCAAETAY